MHARASNYELVEPLAEPERTLNHRLRRRNRRVPFERRNERPEHPRIIYPPILDINHFCHFLNLLEKFNHMDDEPMWAANHVVASTFGPAITIPETTNEFSIKGNHLTLVKGNQFDGRFKIDTYKHIYEFLDVSRTRLDELNEGTIKSWDELRTTFISRFFPPDLFDRLLEEIRAFSQHEHETLTDAWLRMKDMLRNFHGHNLTKGNIIKIFCHGFNKTTQEALNAAVDGIFLYKTPNQAYQLLEDKVSLKLDWAKNQKPKPSLTKIVAFTNEGGSNFDTDKIMVRIDAVTMTMNAQYKEI
nr:hypothetical protein [Tanacetum cinerariifolium]